MGGAVGGEPMAHGLCAKTEEGVLILYHWSKRFINTSA